MIQEGIHNNNREGVEGRELFYPLVHPPQMMAMLYKFGGNR
jgi:hypothetical protein